MYKVTRGHVLIKIHDAKEEEEGIALIDAGNTQRTGTVIEIAKPYQYVGKADFEEGDVVMVPSIGSNFEFIDGGELYMVLLQSEIKVVVSEDSQQ